jgi:hypothetical protein
MNKETLAGLISESLLPLLSVVRWWGFSGSYAHQPMSTELRKGKDIDILIWLNDKSQSDEILKRIAEQALYCNVLIHPVVLLDQDRERYAAIEMYKAMITSVEKIYDSQRPHKLSTAD